MPRPLPREQGPRRSGPEMAARLRNLCPRVPFLVRLRGIKGCKTWEHRLSLHVAHAARFLRKHNLSDAQAELKEALAASEKCAPGFASPSLRSVLTEVRRDVLRVDYEAALDAAAASTRGEAVLLQLMRARRVAEEMADLAAVKWVDQMIQGPRLQSEVHGGRALPGEEDRYERRRAELKGDTGRRVRGREEQREQFRRVAQDSRAYASKRLRSFR